MMAITKFVSLFILTILLLLFQVRSGAQTHYYVHHSCPVTEQFATNDTFENVLENLLNVLSTKISSKGFISSAFGRPPNIVFGQALCRGDISHRKTCQRCIRKASNNIRAVCPHNKKAIMWYEKCWLRYSDTSFHGQMDDENKLVVITGEKVSKVKLFKETRSNLLYRLAHEALANEKRFAMGKFKLDESTTLYGLSQCTLDLSTIDCRKCLNYAVAYLKHTAEKMGAYFISESCTLRYETYAFSLMFKI